MKISLACILILTAFTGSQDSKSDAGPPIVNKIEAEPIYRVVPIHENNRYNKAIAEKLKYKTWFLQEADTVRDILNNR